MPGTIWGASFLFIAEGLDAMAPLGVTFVRLLIGFLTLSAVPAARRPLAPGDVWPMAALSIIWLAFPLSMFPFAEQHVSSAIAGMLNGATAIIAAIVAGLLARQWPDRAVLVGLAVGVAGIVLMAVPSIDGASSAAGIAMIVAAVTSYGAAINLARPLQMRSGALPVVWRTLGVATIAHRAAGPAGPARGALDRPVAALDDRARRVRHGDRQRDHDGGHRAPRRRPAPRPPCSSFRSWRWRSASPSAASTWRRCRSSARPCAWPGRGSSGRGRRPRAA